MSSLNRFEVKKYYRKSAGFMSFMNGLFMVAVVAISFYIAENFAVMANSSSESDNGIASLFYMVAFFGLFVSVFSVITGVSGMRKDKDENFKTQRVSAILSAILYVMYIWGTIVSFSNDKFRIEDTFYIAIYIIGAGASLVAGAYCVMIILFAGRGLKYSDDKKGKVSEIPAGLNIDMLKGRNIAVRLSGVAIIYMCIWMFCWYFEREIITFETNMAIDCGLAAMIYRAVKYLGYIGVLYLAVSAVLNAKNIKAAKAVTKQSIIYNAVVLVVMVIFSISTMSTVYVKSGYPALEYYIFVYVLAALVLALSVLTYSHICKKSE